MLMLVAIGAIVTMPVAMFSPLLSVFWLPLMAELREVSVATRMFAFEAVCLSLLGLEIWYFRNLGTRSGSRLEG